MLDDNRETAEECRISGLIEVTEVTDNIVTVFNMIKIDTVRDSSKFSEDKAANAGSAYHQKPNSPAGGACSSALSNFEAHESGGEKCTENGRGRDRRRRHDHYANDKAEPLAFDERRRHLEGKKESGRLHNSSRSDGSRCQRRSQNRMRSKSRDRHNKSVHRREQSKWRKRHGRRSSSRSSKSRSRSRSSETRKDHGFRGRTHFCRSSSSSSSDNYSTEDGGYLQRKYRTEYDSYKYQEPNSTVMVRGLASHITEKHIRDDIVKSGILAKDVRLIRNHDTGASRGFAFVEFSSVVDATRWMEMKKGVLVLHGEFQASLIYSNSRSATSERTTPFMLTDWNCEKCYAQNFKRRQLCYRCHTPKPDREGNTLSDEISPHPTCKIVLYNLDILTTEEGILQAFQAKPSMACIPIQAVKVSREEGTNMSTGKCYVQTNTVSEAIRLISEINQEQLEIDGRTVSAAYGRSANPAKFANNNCVAAAAVAAAQWTKSTATLAVIAAAPCTEVITQNDVEKMADYYAQLYATTADEYSKFLEYYRQYYTQEMEKGYRLTKEASTYNPSNLIELQDDHHSLSMAPNNPVVAASVRIVVFSATPPHEPCIFIYFHLNLHDVPDMNSYKYDEISDYYFNSKTGLYYDARTKYFYSVEKQQFLRWNSVENKYVTSVTTPNGFGDGDGKKQIGKQEDEQHRVKMAKQIAKKMEKWAKKLNHTKSVAKPIAGEEANSPTISKGLHNGRLPSVGSSLSSKMTLNVPSTFYQEYISQSSETGNTMSQLPPSTVLNNHQKTSGQDEEPYNMGFEKLAVVNQDKLACLLCKRKFSSKEVLQKHIAMSALHKKNLEAREQKPGSYIPSSLASTSKMSYRDRALEMERRTRFGWEKSPSENTLTY